MTTTFRNRSWGVKLLAGLALLVLASVLIVVLFPWDILRGPINRYVSEQTGRKFEITRRFDVKLGRTTRVLMDGIEFANPPWASDPYLIKADSAEVHLRLWPLLRKQVEIPYLLLRRPALGLQMESDGRRTWALGKDTRDEGSVPSIGRIQVDQGSLHYLSSPQEADVRVEFTLKEGSGDAMPLAYEAKGTWKKQPFSAEGRTGSVLQLGSKTEAQSVPFPMEIKASAGRTQLDAAGTVGNLAQLQGIDVKLDLRGETLADLYKLLGVALPNTPPYALKAQLRRRGATWEAEGIQGTLGASDLSGALTYAVGDDKSVPRLTGKVQSRRLDFDDLGPLISLQKTTGKKVAVGGKPSPKRTGQRVLPNKKLDLARLRTMDADVSYTAASVRHAIELPLERIQVRVQLDGGRLKLDPLDLSVAGGTVKGRIHVDSTASPPKVEALLDAKAMQLNALFPAVERMKASFGRVNAKLDLKGQGGSIAEMLASSSGSVGMLTGKGEFSNILLEFVGLDGGEVIKFFVRGDRNVQLRCAAAAFDVKQGVMESHTFLLDTADTVVYGQGTVSFVDESLRLRLEPKPKDMSILSFRSPLDITGTFGAPRAFPDRSSLAGRAALALGLAAINPLLALAATIETGGGQDVDCAQSLAEATSVAKTKAPDAPAR